MATLEENLILAHRAIQFVKERLPYGASNRPESMDEAQRRVIAGRLLSTFVLLPAHHIISLFSTSPLDALGIYAFSSKMMQAGNCGEQSAIALGYLKELGVKDLDAVFLDNGDHNFMVIGRDAGSNISDFRTWGKNAVVCDPWAGRYYPVSDIEFQLNNILDETNFGGFNPVSQTICSNYSEHQLDSAPVKLTASPADIEGPKERYKAFEKSQYEVAMHKKFSDVSDRLGDGAFILGAAFVPPCAATHMLRFRFPKARAAAVAYTIAAAGFFAASAIASQSAKYARTKSEEIVEKQHSIWK